MPIFYNQGAMRTELILAGNGPGELTGWIRPTAEAARAAAQTDGGAVSLTLALLPTQFAGGREFDTARSWNLFDRIVPPGECLRLAAGVGRLDLSAPAALVHLGGDLWLSGRLAARLRIPACAFSETTLIARRHHRFARIFVPTDAHAARLRGLGVPAAKITVTGDPRVVAPARVRRRVVPDVVTLLPGSRDRVFRVAMPLMGDIAAALRAARPAVTVNVVASPFLSSQALQAAQRDAGRRWPELPLRWITGNPWPALSESAFALALPGTMTLELAAAGIPFATLIHLDHVGVAAVEGPLEWIARATGVHRLIKQYVLNRYRRSVGYLALPNQRAGREIAPEWVGRWTAADVAHRIETLLDNPDGLAAMSADLARLYAADTGAPSAIVDAAMRTARAA